MPCVRVLCCCKGCVFGRVCHLMTLSSSFGVSRSSVFLLWYCFSHVCLPELTRTQKQPYAEFTTSMEGIAVRGIGVEVAFAFRHASRHCIPHFSVLVAESNGEAAVQQSVPDTSRPSQGTCETLMLPLRCAISFIPLKQPPNAVSNVEMRRYQQRGVLSC